jgi:hypothetical protein
VPATVPGHDFAFTPVGLTLTPDGRFVADVGCDLDALALGVDSSADSAALAAQIAALPPSERADLERRLIELLKRRLRIRFDGQPVPFDVLLPERGQAKAPGSVPTTLGLVAQLQGAIPPAARSVSFFASRAFPPVRLDVVLADRAASPTEVLAPGEESRAHPLGQPLAAPSFLQTAARFLGLGFTHILPDGIDHVLFVLGLALLSKRLVPLLAQVTCFTLAHTVSLALSLYGLAGLPSRVVEPLIALSIVYVAVENMLTAELRPARLVLVFAFGLLHGLGFAGALRELGWPEGQRFTALLAFNAGVEAGQLVVIGLAFFVLAALGRLGVDRRRLVRGVSAVLGAIGLYWAIARFLEGWA